MRKRSCANKASADSRQRDDGNDQPAAPHAPPYRSEPRHRPRHGQAFLRRRLARHHLLAASVPGELSVGGRARGPHPGRSGEPGKHRGGDRGNQAPARRRAARAGQQCRDLAQDRERPAARLDRHAARRLAPRFPGEFLCSDHARARPPRRAARQPKAPSSTSLRSPARACTRSPAPPMRPRRRRSRR